MNTGRLLVGALIGLAAFLLASLAGLDREIALTLGITALTASWWVSEAMPIGAASLVPFALLPLAGVIDQRQAAAALGSYVIILLMASLMLSKALEKSGAHERLALIMIGLIGTSGRRLVFAFMLTAAALSMWISNTATSLMLATMASAILSRGGGEKLAVPLLLGIAYAASLGGAGTLIGTTPNLIFADAYFATTGTEYSFLRWLKTGLPVVLLGIPLMAAYMTLRMGKVDVPTLPEKGAWTIAERRTLTVFAVAILLWVTRSEPFGGWSTLLGMPLAGDSTVAVLAVVAMFLIPDGRDGTLLDWEAAAAIPWGLLLLFAGGICLATGFRESGLDQLIADQLSGIAKAPLLLMLLGLCLSVSFLTEVTSNTATANLLMPLLAAVAAGANLPPELIMIPAAISCSCAFMLPVSTAPNAIVFSSGRLKVRQMAQTGATLNVGISIVIVVVSWLTLS